MRVLVLSLVLAGSVAAQPVAESLDTRMVRAVYALDAPLATGVLSGVNDTAYPVFLAAAPVAGAVALATDGDLDVALRLGLAQVGTTALTLVLKRLIGRERPYRAVPGIAARDPGHVGDDVVDPDSFPSGHTSIAVALATSLSLSVPEGYVIVPAALWAGTMGVARVWMGVHYPSDVLAGAVLGAGVAVGVHVLVPEGFGDEGPTVAPFRVAIPL